MQPKCVPGVRVRVLSASLPFFRAQPLWASVRCGQCGVFLKVQSRGRGLEAGVQCGLDVPSIWY